MGAGNPIVRSYDEERISITTFFFEQICDVDTYIKEYTENNDGQQLSIDSAYDYMAEDGQETFKQMFYVDGLDVVGYEGDTEEELSAAFRGAGIIFATGKNVMVVVPTGCDYHHIAFGFVPRASWNSFWEEAWDDNAHKQHWYEQRGLDFDARMEEIADNNYEKYIHKCNAEIKKIAAQIAKQFGNKYFEETFRVRSCAWTSSPINKTQFKKLALI